MTYAPTTPPKLRLVKPAIWKGWRKRCPNCGTGKLFAGYLKVNDQCAHCDQELFHQRADDGPAYLTIITVGHIVMPLIHITYVHFIQDPVWLSSIFVTATLVSSLMLLPRFKGLMIGFQWAKEMHGFGAKRD